MAKKLLQHFACEYGNKPPSLASANRFLIVYRRAVGALCKTTQDSSALSSERYLQRRECATVKNGKPARVQECKSGLKSGTYQRRQWTSGAFKPTSLL